MLYIYIVFLYDPKRQDDRLMTRDRMSELSIDSWYIIWTGRIAENDLSRQTDGSINTE